VTITLAVKLASWKTRKSSKGFFFFSSTRAKTANKTIPAAINAITPACCQPLLPAELIPYSKQDSPAAASRIPRMSGRAACFSL